MRLLLFWERWGGWARAHRLALVAGGFGPIAVAMPIALLARTPLLGMNPGALILYCAAPVIVWAWGLLIAAAWFAPGAGAFSRWRESRLQQWIVVLAGGFLCL